MVCNSVHFRCGHPVQMQSFHRDDVQVELECIIRMIQSQGCLDQ